MKFKAWIHAARLRTLPLSVSGIIVGSAVAYSSGSFNGLVFTLLLITTLLLQILSNFANDYGDYSHGIDNDQRVGPERTLQSGQITSKQMKMGIIITSLSAFISGFCMLYLAIGKGHLLSFLLFVLIGMLAILAALKYTIGHNPFGYKGLGDLMVFIFFGMVSVTGSFFLLSKSFNLNVLLPAASIGFLSTGVLNINNLRDVENDRISGKNTLVVKMGGKTGRLYHLFLINAGILSMVAYLIIIDKYWGTLILILPIVLLYFHSKKIVLNKVPKALDPELKRLSLITLLISVITASVIIF